MGCLACHPLFPPLPAPTWVLPPPPCPATLCPQLPAPYTPGSPFCPLYAHHLHNTFVLPSPEPPTCLLPVPYPFYLPTIRTISQSRIIDLSHSYLVYSPFFEKPFSIYSYNSFFPNNSITFLCPKTSSSLLPSPSIIYPLAFTLCLLLTHMPAYHAICALPLLPYLHIQVCHIPSLGSTYLVWEQLRSAFCFLPLPTQFLRLYVALPAILFFTCPLLPVPCHTLTSLPPSHAADSSPTAFLPLILPTTLVAVTCTCLYLFCHIPWDFLPLPLHTHTCHTTLCVVLPSAPPPPPLHAFSYLALPFYLPLLPIAFYHVFHLPAFTWFYLPLRVPLFPTPSLPLMHLIYANPHHLHIVMPYTHILHTCLLVPGGPGWTCCAVALPWRGRAICLPHTYLPLYPLPWMIGMMSSLYACLLHTHIYLFPAPTCHLRWWAG